jgi:hypothetical protein
MLILLLCTRFMVGRSTKAPAGPDHLICLAPSGEAEAKVLHLACDQVLNLQIIFLPIISLVNRASVDLAISLPMSVVTVRALCSNKKYQ